jgi:hypothetical protein
MKKTILLIDAGYLHPILAKSNFCPIGDFFKPCPSRAKAGFKKSPSG